MKWDCSKACFSQMLPLLWLVVLVGCNTTGCDTSSEQTTTPKNQQPDALVQDSQEPTIRVRIARSSQRVTLSGPTKITIKPEGGDAFTVSTPINLRLQKGKWYKGKQLLFTHAPSGMSIRPFGQAMLKVNNQPYPGYLRIDERDSDHFDVINYLPIESYIPGVLDKELYDHWHINAYRAQAIVARSYALAKMVQTRYDRFDVENTQASQVYQGYSANWKARQATRDTHGIVLSDKDKIIKAFFSSTCGGAGLSPTDAFGISSPTPLVPKYRCTYCSDAKNYTWKPVVRDLSLLTLRLSTYGKRHNLPLAQLKKIKTIEVAQRNQFKRPTRFVVIDFQNKRYPLRADSFRVACNTPVTVNNKRQREQTLLSSYFEITIEKSKVIFHHGRGHGHGVGMCQYGAQKMARTGKDSLEILWFYYPGAKAERAY